MFSKMMQLRSQIAILFITTSMLALQYTWAQSKTELERLLISSDSIYLQSKKRVEAYCLKHSISRSFSDDETVYLMIDVTATGVPLYIKTDNAGVASSLGINHLRSGGSLGVDILGTDMKVGVWDGGRVRNSHIEFGPRIQNNDGASNNSNHATHVAGTIVASGVNNSARGMAPESFVMAYDFDNDLAEMTALAKPDQSTLLLSNHSYGTLAGWNQESNGTWTWYGDASISALEDYKFGFYDNRTRLWDQLAFNAPYYTIVKSAGNDRSDIGDGSRSPDGPYNSISTYGNAKNIITVGAVSKVPNYTGPQSVQMSSFSSWGPTDDGRIKPDLVAPGVGTLSTSSSGDNSYSQLDGTSMASPAVTGGLVLLQQLYSRHNDGDFMRAATLKALTIHTAKEAGGSIGPDYQFGWGLLDVEAAGRIILSKDNINTQIIESSLENNQIFEIELNPIDSKKITATLVWTDPAGTPPPVSLNPTTRMLVNDLDMRIVDEEGSQQFPWILDPSTPALPAIRGDNSRDNVEKIEFENPLPRKYFLRITHKGSLVNNSQAFSLILTYTSVEEMRATYYWVNGSGDWSDGSHWSLSSGGSPVNATPTSDDRVVFDGNSFSGNGSFVNLSETQSIYSFSWFCPFEVNFNLNNQTVTIHEGILILNDKMFINSPGIFNVHALDEGIHTINSSQQNLQNLDIQFSQGNWAITKNLNINRIIIDNGSVDLTHRQIRISEILDSGVNNKHMNLSGTKILAQPNFKFTLNHATQLLTDLNSQIEIESSDQAELLLGTNYFNGTLLLKNGAVLLNESVGFNRIFGEGSLNFNSNLFINELDIDGGSVMYIGPGTVQTFTKDFLMRTSAEEPILISSDELNKGTISISGNHKICLEYLILENVDYEGEATVNIGQFSQFTNAQGWLMEDCDDLLFADFEVLYACKDSYVHTVNNSSGNVVSYQWYVDGELVSTDENVIFDIENPGSLAIRLEVQDGLLSKSFEKLITPAENPLPLNYLVLSDTRLISFRSAESYRWMLNGEIIEGENQRFIHYTMSPGTYSVLTFFGDCNRVSEPFLITSLESSSLQTQSAYPNPVIDYLNINTSDLIVQCLAYDIAGRNVELDFVRTQYGITVDMQRVVPGIYILKIVSSSGTQRKIRIVKN